jgi:hypothetical protein
MSSAPSPTPAPVSGRRLAASLLVAGALATSALVAYILPSSYGIDPLGVGNALGVTSASALPEQGTSFAPRADTVELTLAPNRTLRWGFELAAGSTLAFAWGNATRLLPAPLVEAEASETGERVVLVAAGPPASWGENVVVIPFDGRVVFHWALADDATELVTLTFVTDGPYNLLGAIR